MTVPTVLGSYQLLAGRQDHAAPERLTADNEQLSTMSRLLQLKVLQELRGKIAGPELFVL